MQWRRTPRVAITQRVARALSSEWRRAPRCIEGPTQRGELCHDVLVVGGDPH